MKILFSLFLSFLCLLAGGCGKSEDEPVLSKTVSTAEGTKNSRSTKKKNTGKVPRVFRDLDEIKKHGVLRILTTVEPELSELPCGITPRQYEEALFTAFAEKIGVDLKILYFRSFDELIPALLAGEGDIIAANMTATAKRTKKIDFSLPIATTTEEIIAAASNDSIKEPSDLDNKTFIIERGTCYWERMELLKRQLPGMKLEAAPEGTDTEELLYRTGTGKIKYTVADSNYVDAYMKHRSDIKAVYRFPGKRHIAWGIGKNSPALLSAVNSFLKKKLPEYKSAFLKGDLDKIKQRGILRVLTRNNPWCYFIHRGELMGFEYELAGRFAKKQGLRLVMVVPPEWDDLIPWLKSGKGDIIAACMTITPEREKINGVNFCYPYCEVREKFVCRKNSPVNNISDLKGRSVYARRNSSYWKTLEELREKGAGFKLIAVPETMETYEIIQNLAKGKYDLTLADDNIIELEKKRCPGIVGGFSPGKTKHYGWMVRSSDKKLKNAVDAFFRKENKSTFFNLCYRKYFRDSAPAGKFSSSLSSKKKGCVISPFDPLIKKYSERDGFHWCLIASQIFQESRFNPNAKAWDGGMGLMQLMPRTAKELGCKKPFNPKDNVSAGVKYMARLKGRVKDRDIHEQDKVCFALASYNGGYGHLTDARRLARELRLNPQKWDGNVEKAYLCLSRKKYYSKAKYGCCRSDIITKYVNDIMLRYGHYSQEAEKAP